MAARAVDVNTAPPGIPSRIPNIAGFTARMYDIVRNVVIPATISVLTVVLVGSKPNNFLSMGYGFRLLECILSTYSRHDCKSFLYEVA